MHRTYGLGATLCLNTVQLLHFTNNLTNFNKCKKQAHQMCLLYWECLLKTCSTWITFVSINCKCSNVKLVEGRSDKSLCKVSLSFCRYNWHRYCMLHLWREYCLIWRQWPWHQQRRAQQTMEQVCRLIKCSLVPTMLMIQITVSCGPHGYFLRLRLYALTEDKNPNPKSNTHNDCWLPKMLFVTICFIFINCFSWVATKIFWTQLYCSASHMYSEHLVSEEVNIF